MFMLYVSDICCFVVGLFFVKKDRHIEIIVTLLDRVKCAVREEEIVRLCKRVSLRTRYTVCIYLRGIHASNYN